MMYVNEAFADLPIAPFEVEAAGHTTRSVVLDALISRLRIALVTVHQHAPDGSLWVGFAVSYLTECGRPVGLHREAGSGNLIYTPPSFLYLRPCEEIGVTLFEHKCLDGKVHSSYFDQLLETCALLRRSEQLPGQGNTAVVADGAEKVVGPIAARGCYAGATMQT